MHRAVPALISLLLAAILGVAAQAHFTARFTPGLAAQIDDIARMSWRATHVDELLSFNYFKLFFGTFDALVAILLCGSFFSYSSLISLQFDMYVDLQIVPKNDGGGLNSGNGSSIFFNASISNPPTGPDIPLFARFSLALSSDAILCATYFFFILFTTKSLFGL
ncbi:hypothetical protein GRF29_213g1235561 [Pseudopithomyces chartarum]|uniref:Uncharacterized protein n=1 Tax=Pseudopithomyces chartarum TaxID=1892770 RepID=A0AAN6LMY1_9PLEO|nr:hypothetical protein GRF29_213g1235561 [Pseudopithomyces chartarum]